MACPRQCADELSVAAHRRNRWHVFGCTFSPYAGKRAQHQPICSTTQQMSSNGARDRLVNHCEPLPPQTSPCLHTQMQWAQSCVTNKHPSVGCLFECLLTQPTRAVVLRRSTSQLANKNVPALHNRAIQKLFPFGFLGVVFSPGFCTKAHA